MTELEVPEELKELMLDYRAGIQCRDKSIESFFRAKRAINYGKGAEKARRKFWQLVYELYPDVANGEWVYNHDSGTLIKKAPAPAER